MKSSQTIPLNQSLLDEITALSRQKFGQGEVASYIPALSRVAPEQFGIAVYQCDGTLLHSGDSEQRFTIQSVSKVLSLAVAMQRYDEAIWQRVGREPSGRSFNSLAQLEYEHGIPRNPLINAGALVITDALVSRLSAPKAQMLQLARELCGNEALCYDQEVARSEYEHRYRNAAMAYLMKSFGNIHNKVDEVLRTYFKLCALEMNCIELAQTFSFLANRGVSLATKQPIISPRQTRQLNAILLTCGLYDASGDFAYRVGMPGKSGVGGGVLAVIPGEFVVAVWSPELDSTGNSVAGTYALEQLTSRLGLSIF